MKKSFKMIFLIVLFFQFFLLNVLISLVFWQRVVPALGSSNVDLSARILFQPIPETRANTYKTSAQVYPSVSALNDTVFVVSWTSMGQDGDDYGVYATVFDSMGANLTNEFRCNAYTTSAQQRSSVSALNDTTFIVAWESYEQDGDVTGVYATVFDSTGANLTNEFRCNTNTTSFQRYPSVSGLNDTTFIVAWESFGQDGDGFGVYATVFDSTGANLTNEFRCNTNTTSGQQYPSVSGLNDTTFIATWESGGQDGDGYGVYATVFDSTGTNLTNEFRCNTYTTSSQVEPYVSALNDTTFIVTWESSGQDGDGNGVYATVFDSTGANLTNEFRCNTYTTSDQQRSSVSALNNTTFIVTWESFGQDGGGNGVYASVFDSTGAKLTNEFRCNAYTTSDQQRPSVSALPDKGGVVAWESSGQDGSSYSVYFGGFFFDNTPPQSNSPPNATYIFGSPSQVIAWVLTDDVGAGMYRVLTNTIPYLDWTTWTNGTNLAVPVLLSVTGTLIYTIEYNDSAGFSGAIDTVTITITNPIVPVPGFEFVFILLGLLGIVGFAFALRRKRIHIS